MLKTQRTATIALTVILDALALFIAFSLAWGLRDSLGDLIKFLAQTVGHPVEHLVRHSAHRGLRPAPATDYDLLLSPNPLVGFRQHLWIFYLAAPAWIFFLNAQRGYDVTQRRSGRQLFALCAYAGLLGTAGFLVLLFLSKYDVSRLLMLGYMGLSVVLLWTERALVMPVLQRSGRRQLRNMLVIGDVAAARHLREFLQSPVYRGSRILGYINDVPPEQPGTTAYLGGLEGLENVLDQQIVDEVVIVRSATEASNPNTWGNVLELCLQRGRTVSMVDDITPPVGAKMEATTLAGMPTLVMHNTPQSPLGMAAKSLADRSIAMAAILALAPVLAAIALAIKLSSPGPVLFKQKRVGLNGRQFSFYKFRSMRVDAEKFKDDHPEIFAGINTMSGPFFKSEDDPRVTRVGKILRKYSLDELPQFWNVLRGDMSLVGPRPPLPREVAQLQPWQRRKLSVKGGLTCLWQVSGRNDIDTEEWMRLDLEYIDNWSLWLDAKLLLQTVKVLVRPRGAS